MVKDLVNYDACYVPPASPVWEPINIAAIQMSKLLTWLMIKNLEGIIVII